MHKLLVGLTFAASTQCSLAACKSYLTGGGSLNYQLEPAIFYVTGFTTPTFNPMVPNGTVLYSSTARPVYHPEVHFECRPASGTFYGRSTEEPNPIYNTYSTTVAGIGVRLKYGGMTSWFPHTYPPVNTKGTFTTLDMEVEFVKTGPITAGGTLRGEIGGVWLANKTYQLISFRVSDSIVIKPAVPTCSVSKKQIDVSLSPRGGLSSAIFTGIDSTSPSRDFSLQLTCSGGIAGTSTNAYVTLTDQGNAANRSDSLSLTLNSTAKGLGVQILKDGKPLKFGPDSSAAGTVNQWKAGSIPQGQATFSIPLTARYIQKQSVVKAGSANANATFTMSYQ
jgi:type 1 fimbria pilin